MSDAPGGAAWCLLFLGGGAACAPPLMPMPPEASGEAVAVETNGPSRYAVLLAQAVAVPGGDGVDALATTVVHDDAGKPPLTITSSTSDWDLRNKKASFSGSVVVTRGDVTLRCAALEVAYGTGDSVESVVATGGVVVEKRTRVARAGRAELVGATGQVTLTEQPRLVDGPNELVGNRIVLWLDDERAQCEGALGAPCTLAVAGWAVGP